MANSCDSIQPCWQYFAAHEAVQPPTQWAIDLATSYVRFACAALPHNPSYEETERLKTAINLLQSLLSARWRNCVRSPYSFKQPTKVTRNETSLADLFGADSEG